MKIMERHKLKCQIFGTLITQCGAQINTVRHQSANIRNEKEKLPQRKRGRRRVPRAASCAIASLQRGKDFPVASKARSESGAVSGQEDGKYRGGGREWEKGSKNSSIIHTKWRQKAMVPGEVRALCSIVRLAK